MQYRYDTTIERTVYPATEVDDASAAWLTLCLAEMLDDWFGQMHRTLYREGDAQLQLGYQAISFPTADYAENYGPLVMQINTSWPLQSFGTARNGELVGISFSPEKKKLRMSQHSTSGTWYESLDGLYLNLQFPDAASARCLAILLQAAETGQPVVALPWKDAAFLESQQLASPDRTLSYCYVALHGEEQPDPLACLTGLTLEQKQSLWQLFLEGKAYPPEFEWLWDQLSESAPPPDWTEWSLALYQVLDRLHFHFVCSGSQFELQDGDGKRLYFSVDHNTGAERVLMKVLFPLNR